MELVLQHKYQNGAQTQQKSGNQAVVSLLHTPRVRTLHGVEFHFSSRSVRALIRTRTAKGRDVGEKANERLTPGMITPGPTPYFTGCQIPTLVEPPSIENLTPRSRAPGRCMAPPRGRLRGGWRGRHSVKRRSSRGHTSDKAACVFRATISTIDETARGSSLWSS
jgi:hypothetical protein